MASVKTSQLRVRDYGFFLYHLAAARELVVKSFLLKLLSGPFGRTEGRPSVSECLTTFSRTALISIYSGKARVGIVE